MKSSYKVTAALLDDVVPLLPPDTIVVPVPTIGSHIRQRGYDHALLMAKEFARQRELQMTTALERITTAKQRGANRKERFTQAEAAFRSRTITETNQAYLLIDDVVTTGATLQYAAKSLQEAGAQTIWVAALARQPLDK